MSWGKVHNCSCCENQPGCQGFVTYGDGPCPSFRVRPDADPVDIVVHHTERMLRIVRPGFYR